MATKRISSHLILPRYALIKNQTYLQFMMFSWLHLKFFIKLIIHNFYKKEEYQHLHGRCENIWLILKRDRKCQCHIWTSCWWRFAHFELAPESTITNTTSYENLDVTAHPLFLIVNWTSPFTIVCWVLVLVFKNPRKFLSNGKKVLNFLIWYFDFWKLMSDSSLLNLKILNLLFLKF